MGQEARTLLKRALQKIATAFERAQVTDQLFSGDVTIGVEVEVAMGIETCPLGRPPLHRTHVRAFVGIVDR